MKNIVDCSDIKIIICCHKKCELPQDDIFLPIQVGAALNNNHWGIQRDDKINDKECDNISNKNKSYCELTAMYWAWKNIDKLFPNLKFIGINHYRRYFSFNEIDLLEDAISKKESEITSYQIKHKKLTKILSKFDGIVSRAYYYPYPLHINYDICHMSEDLRQLRKVVHELYPEYDQSFYDVIMRNNGLSHYNMTIIKKELYDSYCEWLFNILFETEKRIDISNYTPLQQRIWGYMAERLFNVWLYKNKIKTKKLNVIKYDNSGKRSLLKKFYRKLVNPISYIILRPIQKTNNEF